MTYSIQETASAVVLTPAATTTCAVIWLHGLGADGYDFVPIVEEMQLPSKLGARFIFPHARQRPVTINNGFVMRAWYDIRGFGLTSAEDEAGVRESDAVVRNIIDEQVAGGVDAQCVVLAGFSQGGAMALHSGLRYPQRLAGIIGLSTYLPLRDTLEAERSPANHDVPILMCHGTRDQVVPEMAGKLSAGVLTTLGYRVEWHGFPMEHQVCAEEVTLIARWLRDRLER
jgi:phospholipase/carboxylesterase